MSKKGFIYFLVFTGAMLGVLIGFPLIFFVIFGLEQ